MRPWMGTRSSAGVMAGHASLQPNIGHRKAWSSRGYVLLTAAVLLGMPGQAVSPEIGKTSIFITRLIGDVV